MTSIIRDTVGEIVADLAEVVGDLIERSTATAGAAGTLTGGSLNIKASTDKNDFYNNNFLYIFKGTSAGDDRLVDDYAGDTRVFTASRNFTATPDTTSEFIVTRKWRGLDLERSVIRALRTMAYEVHRAITDVSVRVGNILDNGQFEHWDAATTAVSTRIYTGMGASDGWVTAANGTYSRQSGSGGGIFNRYVARIVSDGTNEAYYEFAVPNYRDFAGKTLTVIGKADTATASRVRFRVLDGVTTFTTDERRSGDGNWVTTSGAGDHSGSGGYEELRNDNLTIDDECTQLLVQCYVTAGSAVTVDFDDVRLFDNHGKEVAFRMPPFFDYVTHIYEAEASNVMTATTRFDLDNAIRDEYIHYHDHVDGWRYITISAAAGLAKDNYLMLKGAGYRTDTITVSTTVESPPQLVLAYAVVDLLKSPNRSTEEQRAYEQARAEVDRFLNRGRVAKRERGHVA